MSNFKQVGYDLPFGLPPPWEGRRAPISIVPHVTHTAGTRLRNGNAFFSNSSPGRIREPKAKKQARTFTVLTC